MCHIELSHQMDEDLLTTQTFRVQQNSNRNEITSFVEHLMNRRL